MTELELRNELESLSDRQCLLATELATADDARCKVMQSELEGIVARKTELREELAAVAKDDPAVKELAPRVQLGSYVKAALGNKSLTGAEAELDQEQAKQWPDRDLDGVWVPWAGMAPNRGAVKAADSVTAPPAADTGERINWVSRAFEKTAAAFANVTFTDADPGASEHVVVSAGASGEMRTRDAVKDAESATLTLTSMTPTRLSAGYVINQESVMRLGSGLESTLRNDLSMAVATEVDDQILRGNGTSPQVTGLMNAGTAPTAETTKDTWDTALKKLSSDGLDGIYASTLMELCTLVGVDTGKYVTQLIRTGNAADMTIAQWLMANTGGLRVSALMKAASSGVQEALLIKKGQGGMNALAVFWGGGSQLIRDDKSESARGRIALRMNAYMAFQVLRSAAYSRVSIKTT